MQPDPDFTRYVAARWADLVGAIEREGVAAPVARQVVADVLLARRRGWRRLVRDEHVDVHVWAAVRERAGLPPRPGEVPPTMPRDEPPGPGDGPDEWLARAAAARRDRRLRGARLSLVALLAVVLAGAGATWWESRPEPPAVRQEANPLPVPWYAAGELHLAEVVVSLQGVEAFAAHGDAVVVRRTSGELLHVAADGEVDDLDEAPSVLTQELPRPPHQVPTGRYDVVVQSVPTTGGSWVHLLDSARRTADGEALRLSETGRRAIVVCSAEADCAEPLTVVGVGGAIRLR